MDIRPVAKYGNANVSHCVSVTRSIRRMLFVNGHFCMCVLAFVVVGVVHSYPSFSGGWFSIIDF